MKLRMTIEVELDDNFWEFFEKTKTPDNDLREICIGENFANIGAITKILNIDYLKHEIKP